MIKKANVAGQFYPENKQELTAMLDDFFSNVSKDQTFNHQKSSDKNHLTFLKAIVAPHAGYAYSGPVAAYSYQILSSFLKGGGEGNETEDFKMPTFVILAPSHYEYFEGVSVGIFDAFQTPLGNVSVDTKLAKQLIEKYPKYFSFNEPAYEQEHSLEVQLPFLQYIIVQTLHATSQLRILPMIFGNTNPVEVGNILYELSKKEHLFFIVSSDLSHFMSYDSAVKTDDDTLNDFVDEDIKKIANEAEACGIHGWLALTQVAIKAKWKPELIKYMNSGDTAGDKSRVVGYGSMIYHA